MGDIVLLNDHKEVKEGELCIEWTYARFKDPGEVVDLAKEVLKNYGINVRSLKHTTGNFLIHIDNNLTEPTESPDHA